MEKLRVRLYNVRFGDAILVSVPDRTRSGNPRTRHILIDVGNVLGGPGGEDRVFQPVLEDVLRVLDGRPLDLYVMTHEHLDHVQGLLYARAELGLPPLEVRHAWLAASAAPDYYQRFAEARRKKLEAESVYRAIVRSLRTADEPLPPGVEALLVNNDPDRTSDCVAHLRGLAGRTHYVHRGCSLARRHTFRTARFRIWAPEEDTSIYYGRFQPMALGLAEGGGGGAGAASLPSPPPGVDAGAFFDLVDFRRRGYLDNLLTIDRAANNSSVVFSLEWQGWRLLFPGDAEVRSWREMGKRELLQPVHFLKVSHHGSHNGTPMGELLDRLLPSQPAGGRPRLAAVSTLEGTYHGVPDEETLDRLAQRCQVRTTEGLPDGGQVDIEFEG